MIITWFIILSIIIILLSYSNYKRGKLIDYWQRQYDKEKHKNELYKEISNYDEKP